MELYSVWGFLIVAFATAAFSVTVARSKVMDPVREWAHKHVPMLGALLSCPYCISHWVAFAMTILVPPAFTTQWVSVDWFLNMFALVGVSTFLYGHMLKLTLFQETEMKKLREALKEAVTALEGGKREGTE